MRVIAMLMQSDLPPSGPTAPIAFGSSEPGDVAPLRRKLMTIVIGDVVGYSRLMSMDEEDTHARVSGVFQQVLEPAVCRGGGMLIKTSGDGFLAAFDSVVQAVRCALDIQERVAEQNVDVTPDRSIALRIGINLGDVIA